MTEEQELAMAELSQAIAGEILTLPELSEPEWDTYSMVAEVSDDRVGTTAYRYTESGPPLPSKGPGDLDLFRQLRERTRGNNGAAWDVVLVKIHRDTVNMVMDFFSGEAADRWRVNLQNIANLPEALRPRPEDFAARTIALRLLGRPVLEERFGVRGHEFELAALPARPDRDRARSAPSRARASTPWLLPRRRRRPSRFPRTDATDRTWNPNCRPGRVPDALASFRSWADSSSAERPSASAGRRIFTRSR